MHYPKNTLFTVLFAFMFSVTCCGAICTQSHDDQHPIVIKENSVHSEPKSSSILASINGHSLTNGTCVGDDHATIIGKVFTNNRPPVDCVNGRLYYTDYQYGCFNGTEYPATGPGSEYCGYMLWVGTYDELGDCVEYPEMQYYYNNFCNIMDTILPSGHVFVSIECCVTCYLSVYERQYFFACFYEEAKPNCTNEPIH